MNEIVKKFGGTSVNNIQILKDIIRCNDVIVVSAPGKRSVYDEKVTDLLDHIYQGLHAQKYINNYWDIVKDRFRDLVVASKVDINLTPYFEEIESHFSPNIDRDFLLSRGEYLTAVIFSRVFGMKFVDANDCIKFKNGILDVDSSIPLIKKMVVANTVVPGFYGKENDKIKLFGRGGSDVTGTLIASALQSPEYQNFTDEDGVKMALPNLCNNSRKLEKISFDNMYEFSKSGANILHPNAVKIAKQNNIPIKVTSVYAPYKYSTTIAQEDELRYVKAMGVRENAVRFVISPKVFANNFAEVINFLKENGITFQETIYRNGELEVFGCADQDFDKEQFPRIEKLFSKKFDTNMSIKPTSEIILIIGGHKDKFQISKMLRHFLQTYGFDVEVVDNNQGIALVVEPYNLKFLYKTIYQEFVDTFVNYKPLNN